MKAIVYTTNAGSTAQYAELLSERTGIKAVSLSVAKKELPDGADIIYLGWIMAGCVKGFAGAVKRFRVRAVCGVGIGRTGTQEDSVRRKTGIAEDIPLFTLQGNFDAKKLHGVYRPMMELMAKSVGRELSAKQNRTAEEDDMLDMLLHGGSRVNAENLKAVLDWYAEHKDI